MDLDLAQLRALQAAVAEGTLDAAARRLHLTPSAVSQRLRALETATGRVLLVRSKPVRVTEAGEAVLRVARQVDALIEEASAELAGEEDAPERPYVLAVAVNADSLATWVLPALAPLAGEIRFRLHREDQEHTAGLLRDGTVAAAVTGAATAVPGCTVRPLGRMRYRPVAAAGFAGRWFPDGVTPAALARAPVVSFDERDDLQSAYLRARLGGRAEPAHHRVPASGDFLEAVRLGMGWAMLPDLQAGAGLRSGELRDLDPGGAVDLVLYWQQWKLRSPALDRAAGAVLAGAAAALLPAP